MTSEITGGDMPQKSPENEESKRPRRRRKVRVSGSREDLRRTLWQAVRDADVLLRETRDEATKLRCISAIATAGAVYSNALDAEQREKEKNRDLVPYAEAEAVLDSILNYAQAFLTDPEQRTRFDAGVRAHVEMALDQVRGVRKTPVRRRR